MQHPIRSIDVMQSLFSHFGETLSETHGESKGVKKKFEVALLLSAFSKIDLA